MDRYIRAMLKKTYEIEPKARTKLSSVEHVSQQTSKVKFGNVVITGMKPSHDVIEANIKQGTEALERAVKRLVTPGVVLPAKKNVPQFSIADGETDIFIRRLNGHVERGRLVDGAFQVIE
jgi:hypothetical protein